MKLLILVLSYTEWPFSEFMEVQKNTWDAKEHYDIDVVYYHGGNHIENPTCKTNYLQIKRVCKSLKFKSVELSVDCTDDYNMMHWKLKLALDFVPYDDYDFIFRTNSCSYIVKEKILQVCETLPKTGCYAGYHNGSYISGAGIFFSPDVLKVVHDALTPEPHGAEDVLIGEILAGKVEMTAENSRIDSDVTNVPSYDGYHFRFKTSNDLSQRGRDIDNMRKLHEYLTQNK